MQHEISVKYFFLLKIKQSQLKLKGNEILAAIKCNIIGLFLELLK